MKTLLSVFSPIQRIVAVLLLISWVTGVVGTIVMMVLGGKNGSLHLFDITTGLAHRIDDGFSVLFYVGLFTLLGMYFIRLSDKIEETERAKENKVKKEE